MAEINERVQAKIAELKAKLIAGGATITGDRAVETNAAQSAIWIVNAEITQDGKLIHLAYEVMPDGRVARFIL